MYDNCVYKGKITLKTFQRKILIFLATLNVLCELLHLNSISDVIS